MVFFNCIDTDYHRHIGKTHFGGKHTAHGSKLIVFGLHAGKDGVEGRSLFLKQKLHASVALAFGSS